MLFTHNRLIIRILMSHTSINREKLAWLLVSI